MERYYVATTEGYLSDKPSGKSKGPGVSAMVLDRGHPPRVQWQQRSEDITGGFLARRRDEAVRRAQLVARGLNEGRTLVDAVRMAIPRTTFDRWRLRCFPNL